MAPYIYKRNHEGIHIMNLGKTWEKLMLAARVIAAIPNPRDVLVSAPFRCRHMILKRMLSVLIHDMGKQGQLIIDRI